MNTDIEVPQLPHLGKDLVKAYGKTTYRKNFAFIDHMRGEQDPAIVKRLDEKLVKAIKAEEMTDAIGYSRAVDWQAISESVFIEEEKAQSGA